MTPQDEMGYCVGAPFMEVVTEKDSLLFKWRGEEVYRYILIVARLIHSPEKDHAVFITLSNPCSSGEMYIEEKIRKITETSGPVATIHIAPLASQIIRNVDDLRALCSHMSLFRPHMYEWDGGTDILVHNEHTKNGAETNGYDHSRVPNKQKNASLSFHRFEGLVRSVTRHDLVLFCLLTLSRLLLKVWTITKSTKRSAPPEPLIETYRNGENHHDLHIASMSPEGLWRPAPMPVSDIPLPTPLPEILPEIVVTRKPRKRAATKLVKRLPRKKVVPKTGVKKKSKVKVGTTKKTSTKKKTSKKVVVTKKTSTRKKVASTKKTGVRRMSTNQHVIPGIRTIALKPLSTQVRTITPVEPE